MKPARNLQEQPVKELGLSDNFVSLCEHMRFRNIADIVAIGPEALVHCEGFTFHWLSELISFLQEKNALHLLEGRLTKENIAG